MEEGSVTSPRELVCIQLLMCCILGVGKRAGKRGVGRDGREFFTVTVLALYECKVFIHTLVL